MSYKSVRQILNEIFDSSDSTLKTIYKTDGEVMNMVLDETGDPAIKVKISGLNAYTKAETDSLLTAKMNTSDYIKSAGNIISPLTWLPMKKNLLTQQGQTVATSTRASSATYRDRYGVLKTVANDVARFNGDGVIMEGASTNLFLYSEQFDNASWIKGGSTVSANTLAVTDPYGTNLADKLVEDTSSGAHYLYQSKTLTSGTVYTLSMFARAGERSRVRLYDSVQDGAIFDLAAGTVVSAYSGVSASIVSYSNGWYRCSITYTANATSARNMVAAIASSSTTSYTGDGASGIYLICAQLEAMPFATSYIPTTTASATRAYNNTYFPQAENIPYFGNDFSIVMDVNLKTALSLHQYFLSDGSGQFRLFSYQGTGQIMFIFGGTAVASPASYSNTKIRVAITKTATSLTMYINGVQVATAVTGTIPAHQTNMYVGSYNGTSSHLYGSISNLRIYDRALTAQEVAVA